MSGESPKVSICIPTYKLLEPLKRTLESVCIQSFQDYEVIVTDDTPDESVKSLVENMDFQGRLKYYKNTAPLGSPENWNESMRLASGEYIKILHHDDWFANENSLKRFVELLDAEPDADFAFASCIDCDPETNLSHVHSATDEQINDLRKPDVIFSGNFIGSPSVTIFRANSELLFDTRLKWFVDSDFYIRMLRANNKFVFTIEPLVYVTSAGSDRITAQCIDNPSVEVSECVYLMHKTFGDLDIGRREERFISDIFYRSGIRNIDDLVGCGVDPDIARLLGPLMKVYRYWSAYFICKKSVRAARNWLRRGLRKKNAIK